MNALVTLASVGATSAATSTAIGETVNSPDAELIALGAQFDELERQRRIAEEREAPRQEAYQRAIEALPGDRHVPNEEYKELFAAVDREFGPVQRPSADNITDMMDAPQRRIMALPATTLAGLAVKARVARFSCDHFYDVENDRDADWDHLIARKLIDAVLRFSGDAAAA